MKQHGSLYNEIDEKLEPFSFLMEALSDIAHTQVSNQHSVLEVDELKFDFPYEMDVLVDGNSQLTLSTAPPTVRIESSFKPNIQNMKITIAKVSDLIGEEE
ncbi:MAG: hypothetical protein MK066_13420 [Crocinitomicaceae bacterium]|nr:hypothetical protein [Crocinitomicaceae bacterium]